MNYLQEWQASGVDAALTQMNVVSLQGDRPLDYLLYAENLPRRNDGRVGGGYLERYQHTEQGGWWCSGIDLLTGEEDLWGCFKPEQPRLDGEKNKLIKYEHPPKVAAGVFALRVPLHLWQAIAERYEISLDDQDWDSSQQDGGFWQWVLDHPQIPLVITEGAKKAGALLSAGYAAIALPGVNGAYRTPRDENGDRVGPSRLIPPMEKLAQGQRQIYLAFDQDSKLTTIKNVNAALKKTGYLLKQAGCIVHIISWQTQLGKGVDDLITQQGTESFATAYAQALSFDLWKAQQLQQLTYTPNLQVNQRYLQHLEIPETAQCIALKSPKGTGKTRWLESVVAAAIARQQPVLVIGHRIRLVEQLCQRFGLDYVRDLPDQKDKNNSQKSASASLQIKGYGLCIDSLHGQSQAQFNPNFWKDAVIIIDEVEQVLWHTLNSRTCRSNRVVILNTLKILMQNVFAGEGKLYLSDADLSDVSIDYLLTLGGVKFQPFVIENSWRSPQKEAWKAYHYDDSTPKRLVKELEKHIREGGKPFVCLSAQKLKSQWGTCNLEAYFSQQFPEHKILRIDSESLADPSHPAYGCMQDLNQHLQHYDIVFASPAIETGVSIDLKNHFTSVWAIAQGIQTATSVCQSLDRVRENLPRYLWVAKFGFNLIGNGATNIPSLLTSEQKLTQTNIRLLQQADFAALDDLDLGFQAESLLSWAKMAVRVNAAMLNYRESVLSHLKAEGHAVKKPSEKPQTERSQQQQNQLSLAISTIRTENYQADCQAIAQATNLSTKQYQKLKNRLVKTQDDRHRLRKYELQQRYNLPVTAQLVEKDDQDWYKKLRLHYFLTLGRPYLADRDAIVAKWLMDQGHGSIFQPDFNHSQLGAIIGTMEILGIATLLTQTQRTLHNFDPDLIQMAAIALENRQAIKNTVGIGLAKNSTPIVILRRFLDQIDYGLAQLNMTTIQKKRIRLYQIIHPQDERKTIFHNWLKIDQKRPGTSAFWQQDCAVYLAKLQRTRNEEESNYVQLALNMSADPVE